MKLAGLAALFANFTQDLSATNFSQFEDECSFQELDSYNEVNVDQVRTTVALERQTLSASSIKSVYNSLIAQNSKNRAAIAESMRNDFAGFIQSHFNLSKQEKICVTRYWTNEADYKFINDMADFVENGYKVSRWDLDNCCPENTPKNVHFKYEAGTHGPNIDSEIVDIDTIIEKKRKVEAGWSQGSGYNVKFGIEF